MEAIDSIRSCAPGHLTPARPMTTKSYSIGWTVSGLVDKAEPHAEARSNASGLLPSRWLDHQGDGRAVPDDATLTVTNARQGKNIVIANVASPSELPAPYLREA